MTQTGINLSIRAPYFSTYLFDYRLMIRLSHLNCKGKTTCKLLIIILAVSLSFWFHLICYRFRVSFPFCRSIYSTCFYGPPSFSRSTFSQKFRMVPNARKFFSDVCWSAYQLTFFRCCYFVTTQLQL